MSYPIWVFSFFLLMGVNFSKKQKSKCSKHPFFHIFMKWIVNAKIVIVPQHVINAHVVTASFRYFLIFFKST